MPTVTIIPKSGVMYVDGKAHLIDASEFPTYIEKITIENRRSLIHFMRDEYGRSLDPTPLTRAMYAKWIAPFNAQRSVLRQRAPVPRIVRRNKTRAQLRRVV